MKDLSFVKKKEPEELYHARIVSIDRNKGKVTLFMKNGLFSIGHYLHDLDDLRENMTVLVGKVNDSHVILSKIFANPSNCQGMSFVKPPASDLLNYGIDYVKFWVDGYLVIDDHFTSRPTDPNIWCGLKPTLVYNSGVWEETATVYYEESVNDRFAEESHVPYLLLENSFLFSSIMEWSGLSMFGAPLGSPGSDCTLEVGLQLKPNDLGYRLRAVQRINNTVTVGIGSQIDTDQPTMYYRITKVGKVWNFYYRIAEQDEWTLFPKVSDYTKPYIEDYSIYVGITIFNADYGDGFPYQIVYVTMGEPSPTGGSVGSNEHSYQIGFTNDREKFVPG
jgi:hypothetical protein